MTNSQKINNNTGKVLSALSHIGYFDFKVCRCDEYVEINILDLIRSPYAFIKVYNDVVQFFSGVDKLEYEASPKNKAAIIRAILNK